MPCYTVRTMSVDLNASNKSIMIDALKTLGYDPQDTPRGISFFTERGTAIIADGKISVRQGEEGLVDRIKRAYSETAIKVASKKFRWTLNKTKRNHGILSRR